MNKITRRATIAALEIHGKKEDLQTSDFRFLVNETYRLEILARFEKNYFTRARHLWKVFHPQDFDAEGNALDFTPFAFERFVRLHHIALRVINRKVKRDPALRLEKCEDPLKLTDYQMRLF